MRVMGKQHLVHWDSNLDMSWHNLRVPCFQLVEWERTKRDFSHSLSDGNWHSIFTGTIVLTLFSFKVMTVSQRGYFMPNYTIHLIFCIYTNSITDDLNHFSHVICSSQLKATHLSPRLSVDECYHGNAERVIAQPGPPPLPFDHAGFLWVISWANTSWFLTINFAGEIKFAGEYQSCCRFTPGKSEQAWSGSEHESVGKNRSSIKPAPSLGPEAVLDQFSRSHIHTQI